MVPFAACGGGSVELLAPGWRPPYEARVLFLGFFAARLLLVWLLWLRWCWYWLCGGGLVATTLFCRRLLSSSSGIAHPLPHRRSVAVAVVAAVAVSQAVVAVSCVCSCWFPAATVWRQGGLEGLRGVAVSQLPVAVAVTLLVGVVALPPVLGLVPRCRLPVLAARVGWDRPVSPLGCCCCSASALLGWCCCRWHAPCVVEVGGICCSNSGTVRRPYHPHPRAIHLLEHEGRAGLCKERPPVAHGRLNFQNGPFGEGWGGPQLWPWSRSALCGVAVCDFAAGPPGVDSTLATHFPLPAETHSMVVRWLAR